MAGNGELFPVIKDLKNTIAEIHREYRDKSLPVTDGSPQLHRLCARLEQLLQFDQKERRNLIGNRKDYWDFFCHSLSEMKGGPEGIAFVGSIPELRTPTGRGRAFIRYCLVHQQLADSLQICFMEPKKARDWYYSRNPFLTEGLCSGILAQLYELNTVTFNLSLKRTDLDAAWPLVTGDSYKQSTQRILNHDGENQISENEPLHINVDINRKTVTTQEEKILAYGHSEQQSTRGQKTSEAASGTERIEARAYEAKISSLERQNMELMNKLDTLLKEVSHRKAVGTVEDVQKVSDLLDSLAASEKREIEVKRRNLDLQAQIDKLARDLESSLRAGQELSTALERRDQAHSEEQGRLREELEAMKGRCSEKLEKQSEKASDLLDSNAFLNETLEELDALVNELRQKIASKENEIIQLIETHAEEKAYLAEIHVKELEKANVQQGENLARYEKRQQDLMEELRELQTKLELKDVEMNEIISEHQTTTRESAGLAKSLDELEERLRIQEAERRTFQLECEAQKCQCQQLQAQCQSLQQKLNKREEWAEEQDTRIESLELEVIKLRSTEKQLMEQGSGLQLNVDGKEAELKEEKRILEEQLKRTQLQNEKTAQKLANCLLEKEDLEKEKNVLFESSKSREQSLRSAELEVEDLNKQLLVCQDQTRSLKNAVEHKDQALQDKEKHIRILKKEAEDTSVKLREALSEKSATDARLAEMMTTTVTLANEKSLMNVQVSGEKVKLEEALHEVKRQLTASEEQRQRKEDEMVKVLQKEGHLRQALRQVSREKETLTEELQSAASALKEKTQEAGILGREVEELKINLQNEKAALSEQLAIVQIERDALVLQKKDLEYTHLVLSEEHAQLKCQVKKMELEKLRAEKIGVELETRKQLSTGQSEKEALEEKLAEVTMELGQKTETSQRIEKNLLSELESLRAAKGIPEDKDLRIRNLEGENQKLQSKLQRAETQMMELADLVQKQKEEAGKLKESLNDQLDKVKTESQLKNQILRAKETELKGLAEQLRRASLDCERCGNGPEKGEQDGKEDEHKYLETIAEQKDMIQSLKARVLELVREKDALWKKMEGIDSLDPSLCVGCRKDFKPFSRKHQCRLCRNAVCQACSVDCGKKERCCIPCYQKGTTQVT